MDIKYDEIRNALLSISVVEVTVLSYRSRDYYIDPVSPQGPIAEFHYSTSYNGADIYVWDKVPVEFRRSVILHEIVEADLHMHQNVEKMKAHEEAVKLDNRFARETLDTEKYTKYECFCAEVRD